jgi:hypothetical protein
LADSVRVRHPVCDLELDKAVFQMAVRHKETPMIELIVALWAIGVMYTIGMLYDLYVWLKRPLWQLIFLSIACMVLWPFVLGAFSNEHHRN